MNIFLKEIIDSNGVFIKGNRRLDQSNSMATSKLTTDDAIKSQRQGVSRYKTSGRVYFGEEENTMDNSKIKKNKTQEKFEDSIVETVFTKKEFDREFVNKSIENMDKIENIDSIRETNPILIRKVGALKDIIEKNNASGYEKAVILNYLLDMDLTDISNKHKELLRKKIS